MVPSLAFPSLISPRLILLGGRTSAINKASNPYYSNLISSQIPKSEKSVVVSPSISSSRAFLLACEASSKEENIISSSVNVERQKLVVKEEEKMPKHVALIMDGNRRWALKRGFPAMYGHGAGRMAMKALIPLGIKFGIKTLSVFAFSTENWSRSKEEVDNLMDIFAYDFRSDVEEFRELNVRISVIGDKSRLSEYLQKLITEAEDRTKTNTGMEFNIAINYSGKYDIIQACKSVVAKVKDGTILGADNINENIFEQELVTGFGKYPCPDLLIRTSGEIRLSNFMLWQLAYSELYFTDVLFPDFGEEDLVDALIAYQKKGGGGDVMMYFECCMFGRV